MKKTFLSAALILIFTALSGLKCFSQNECVVHIFSKKLASSIYVDDSLLTSLNSNEAVDFTLKDGERHSIRVVFSDGYNTVVAINSYMDPELYFVAYQSQYPIRSSIAKKVDRKTWDRYKDQFTDVIHIE